MLTIVAWFIAEVVCSMVLEYLERDGGISMGEDVLKYLYAIPLGVASITFVALLVINLRKQKL
jgi:hypothetical protein